MTTPLITNYDLGEDQFNYSNEFIPNVNIIHPHIKVGIGTSDPQYTMDVRNSINVKSNIDVSGSFRFESKPGFTYNSNYIHVLYKDKNAESIDIGRLIFASPSSRYTNYNWYKENDTLCIDSNDNRPNSRLQYETNHYELIDTNSTFSIDIINNLTTHIKFIYVYNKDENTPISDFNDLKINNINTTFNNGIYKLETPIILLPHVKTTLTLSSYLQNTGINKKFQFIGHYNYDAGSYWFNYSNTGAYINRNVSVFSKEPSSNQFYIKGNSIITQNVSTENTNSDIFVSLKDFKTTNLHVGEIITDSNTIIYSNSVSFGRYNSNAMNNSCSFGDFTYINYNGDLFTRNLSIKNNVTNISQIFHNNTQAFININNSIDLGWNFYSNSQRITNNFNTTPLDSKTLLSVKNDKVEVYTPNNIVSQKFTIKPDPPPTDLHTLIQYTDYNLLQGALINNDGKKYDIIHVINQNKTFQDFITENNLSDRLLEYDDTIFLNNDFSTNVVTNILNGISTNSVKTEITNNYHNQYRLYGSEFPDYWEGKVIGVMKKNDPTSKQPLFKISPFTDYWMMTNNQYWVVTEVYDGDGVMQDHDYISTPSNFSTDFYLIIQSELEAQPIKPAILYDRILIDGDASISANILLKNINYNNIILHSNINSNNRFVFDNLHIKGLSHLGSNTTTEKIITNTLDSANFNFKSSTDSNIGSLYFNKETKSLYGKNKFPTSKYVYYEGENPSLFNEEGIVYASNLNIDNLTTKYVKSLYLDNENIYTNILQLPLHDILVPHYRYNEKIGSLRFNKNTEMYELYNGSEWNSLAFDNITDITKIYKFEKKIPPILAVGQEQILIPQNYYYNINIGSTTPISGNSYVLNQIHTNTNDRYLLNNNQLEINGETFIVHNVKNNSYNFTATLTKPSDISINNYVHFTEDNSGTVETTNYVNGTLADYVDNKYFHILQNKIYIKNNQKYVNTGIIIKNKNIVSTNTYDTYLIDTIAPFITSISISNDNSTITVTFNETIYNTATGSGSIEANDFVLSLSGGVATLASTTPTSISPTTSNTNEYILGINLSGTANSSETLTVNPANNSIYDLVGNVASISQSNNSINLIEKIVPFITNISISNDNTTITVTFDETIYNTDLGSGNIEVNDFELSLTGGVATLASTTPTSISPSTSNSNEYVLGINLSGTPNGSETLTVNPANNSIYDLVGNVASTSQSNNSISLIDKIVPVITGISINNTNTEITVTFNETIYNTASGSGNIEANDFVLSLTGGNAILASNIPTTISSTSGNEDEYTLGINVSGTANSLETLTINPVVNSIYDLVGNVLAISQINNTIGFNSNTPYSTTDIRNYLWAQNMQSNSETRGEVGYITISGTGSFSDYMIYERSPGPYYLGSTIIKPDSANGVVWDGNYTIGDNQVWKITYNFTTNDYIISPTSPYGYYNLGSLHSNWANPAAAAVGYPDDPGNPSNPILTITQTSSGNWTLYEKTINGYIISVPNPWDPNGGSGSTYLKIILSATTSTAGVEYNLNFI